MLFFIFQQKNLLYREKILLRRFLSDKSNYGMRKEGEVFFWHRRFVYKWFIHRWHCNQWKEIWCLKMSESRREVMFRNAWLLSILITYFTYFLSNWLTGNTLFDEKLSTIVTLCLTETLNNTYSLRIPRLTWKDPWWVFPGENTSLAEKKSLRMLFWYNFSLSTCLKQACLYPQRIHSFSARTLCWVRLALPLDSPI